MSRTKPEKTQVETCINFDVLVDCQFIKFKIWKIIPTCDFDNLQSAAKNPGTEMCLHREIPALTRSSMFLCWILGEFFVKSDATE